MKRVLATIFTFVVLLTASPAYAADPAPVPPAGQDNGKWVGPISFVIFAIVVAGLVFLVAAYAKNNDEK